MESVKKIAEYYIEHKQYHKAEEKLKNMLEINPLDEKGYEMLMRVYYYMGDRIKLSMQYEQLNTLLTKELNLPIRSSTKQLYKKLLLDLESEK
ncbi:bacterial transcriptional activator domain-containing protein [Desnuesiella massiliensis]|uniref:bacterial transcriptional activator domain-containing protein n=1 Tax=Desnuesiella massiliensis TaxID=1650662 RepID=UPI0024204C4E|nr:bacterial transcriptional activator domain-containing protein [Desnuesiella massiliensis]